MRIVGGRFRRRPLKAPPGSATRPTADRVREALFNILAHGIDDFSIEGVRVLDVFSGTGALGLEALSRGAGYCLFVEDDAEARGVLRENIEALGLTGVSKVWRRDATNLGSCAPMPTFGLMFADPPYGQCLGERAVEAAIAGGWLDDGAMIVLEEGSGVTLNLSESVVRNVISLDSRTYGQAALHFLRYAPDK